MLGLLVDLEPATAALLDRICSGALLDATEVRKKGLFADVLTPRHKAASQPPGPDLFTNLD